MNAKIITQEVVMKLFAVEGTPEQMARFEKGLTRLLEIYGACWSDFMACRIEKLDFSVRTSNCLRNAGIETLGDLVNKTEEEFFEIRHFGRKSLAEVNEKLRGLGLDPIRSLTA